MEYICPYHPEQNFGTREMYSEHIAQRHSKKQDKLLKLDEIDKNAQLAPRPQSGCPLCSYEAETWVDMDKHLAFHLETLALLSLPLATGLERDDVRMESLQLEDGEDDAMQLLDGDAARVLSSLFETESEPIDEDGNQLPQGERITLAALEDLDSKTLALASEDGSLTRGLIRYLFKGEELDWITIKLAMEEKWSPCLQTLKGHSDLVRSVAFSHDSARFASGSGDGTAKIWDASSGECLQTLKGHSGWVMSVAFSHDSTRLASGSDDDTVKIWDASSSDCL